MIIGGDDNNSRDIYSSAAINDINPLFCEILINNFLPTTCICHHFVYFCLNFLFKPNTAMKNNSVLFLFLAIICALSITFSACKKDPAGASNKIQQGNTTIEINAIYTGYYLQVRYNNVINAPIHATVRVYQNGKTMDVPVNISADYKSLQQWNNDDFINVWDYNGYYDSVHVNGLPVITGTVDSVKIIAASCPDKEYGFKIVGGNVDWSAFYHPTDPKTTVSFISNNDTVLYSDYDFTSGTVFYNKTLKLYRFGLYNMTYQMYSAPANYPLQAGLTMDIPVFIYFWNGRNYGLPTEGSLAGTNGSTVKLTITKVSDTHFDATFSGKVWASRVADTLFISKGEIKNALLPVIDQ